MPLIRFECVSCGRSLQSDEGAGEPFRCPSCGHVGTVPIPFAEKVEAAQSSPAEMFADFAAEGTHALRKRDRAERWDTVSRGIRMVYASLWMLVLFIILVVVIDVAAVFLMDDFQFEKPQLGPGARTMIALTSAFLGVLVILLEIFTIIGNGLCLAVPSGGGRKVLAAISFICSLLAAVAFAVTAALVWAALSERRPNEASLALAGLSSLTVYLLWLLRWATFVGFLWAVARSLDARGLTRSTLALLLSGCALFALGLLAGIVAAILGRQRPPVAGGTPDMLVVFELAVGVVSLALVFWYIVVLRRTFTLTRDAIGKE